MSRNKRLEECILRAYEIIGRATPIKADCGLLCGALCCKDSASDDRISTDAQKASFDGIEYFSGHPDSTGMVLFPGEEGLLAGEAGFRLFRINNLGALRWFLVCEGVCDRRKRPLACRIFPLAPYISDGSIIGALLDPRAVYVCPLTGGDHIEAAFRRVVTKAFRFLAKEPEINEYMQMLSADLDDMRRFIKRMK